MEINGLTDEMHSRLNVICSATGRELTNEQKIFASNFTKSTICFADAGTGKTYAMAAGLVMAQTYHRVNGDKIVAITFTKDARTEISNRYDIMRKYEHVKGKVKFCTFHQLCRQIISKAWKIRDFVFKVDYNRQVPDMLLSAKAAGISNLTEQDGRRLLSCVNKMNAVFRFDIQHLEDSYDIRNLNIDPVLFNNIRKYWMLNLMTKQSITQGDLPIIAYYLLTQDEEIKREYTNIFDIMVIDEYQDMTPLYMRIVSILAKSAVVVGDMKQQIYAFNGASDTIIKEFEDSFPEHRVCTLSKSFRCREEITEFAEKLIKPNRLTFSHFEGIGKGGEINIIRNSIFDMDKFCESMKTEYDERSKGIRPNVTSVMFLARVNISLIPIIEKLYQSGVPFRCSNFEPVHKLGIMKPLTNMIYASIVPYDKDKVYECLKEFPEFRNTYKTNNPIIQIMEKTGLSFLEIDYKYQAELSIKLIHAIRQVAIDYKNKESSLVMYNRLYNAYSDYLEKIAWSYEYPPEYYWTLAEPVLHGKDFDTFIYQEVDKYERNISAINTFNGVQCYTIHSAKGLEADEVYIIDAEEKICPNDKFLDKYVRKGCNHEAAVYVRNERNLLYVAVTRAKKKVYFLTKGNLTSLVSSPENNRYSYLDSIYEKEYREYDDTKAFKLLYHFEEGN